LIENEYYSLSSELQQVHADVLEHEESLPHWTRGNWVFSRLGRMMRTSSRRHRSSYWVGSLYFLCY